MKSRYGIRKCVIATLVVPVLLLALFNFNSILAHSKKHSDDHHHSHSHDHHHTNKQQPFHRFDPKIWAEALFATALVGAAPVLVLYFVPLGKSSKTPPEVEQDRLKVFLSFASGGLLGDALLHLLPHSITPHDHHHDHHHEHSIKDLSPWLWCLTGLVAFLILEKVVRAYHKDRHHHHHHHSKKDDDNASVVKASASSNKTSTSTTERLKTLRPRKSKTTIVIEEEVQEVTKPHTIAAAGILNLVGDFSHNFTDGLAIGATFLQGSGWQTTVAMLLHEVPHEIGDFAILLQSGFSRKDAMWLQLSTAIGAMIGTVIGLLMEGASEEKAAWITPFTAGGFVYIACTSVFPEILKDCTWQQSVYQILALVSGIILMIGIALYE